MSTFKDARTFLLESYLDDVINDDELSYSTIRWNLLHPRTRNFHMNYCYYYYYYTIIIILTCYNNITIQKYRNNTLNSSSATSRLLMSFSIPLAIQLASQYVLSREGCSDLELRTLLSTLKLVQVFSGLFLFLSFYSCAHFVPVKGSTTIISLHNISSWRELHTYHWLPKKN